MSNRLSARLKRVISVPVSGEAVRGTRVLGIALLAAGAATAVAACGSASPVSMSARVTGVPGASRSAPATAGSGCGTVMLRPYGNAALPKRVCVRLGSTLTIRNAPEGTPDPSRLLEMWQLVGNSAPGVLACKDASQNYKDGSNPVEAVCRAVKPGVAILGLYGTYVSGGIAQPKNMPVLHVTVTVAA